MKTVAINKNRSKLIPKLRDGALKSKTHLIENIVRINDEN